MVSLLRPSLPSCSRQLCRSLTHSGFPLPPPLCPGSSFPSAGASSLLPAPRTERKEQPVAAAAGGGWRPGVGLRSRPAQRRGQQDGGGCVPGGALVTVRAW